MNRADAISGLDLGDEPEASTDVCISCQREIPVGFLRCDECEDLHEAREVFDEQANLRRG